MAQAVLVVVVCVLFSWETQGSSAVTTVFVQKGKDLHLDVNKPVVIPEVDEFRWRVNDTHNVVRLFPDNKTRIVPSYVGRVEFSVQNHSLLLKNVQHSDSGEYTALITGDKHQRVAEYKVIIQDPVSPVQLSVKSVSNSRESCNLTVTCSTEDSLISSTFTCDNQTCNQEGRDQSKNTTSGSSLRVYLVNDSIICNHSNQVSWTSNITEIWPLCSLNGDPVSPVQLSVNSVSNSRESCNLTVTCSTEDSLISSTFRCDTQTCNQEGGDQSKVTTSGSSLHVYLLNDFITCNHSNQVSWTRDIKEIRPLCSLNTGINEGTRIAIGIVIPVFLLCIFFLYRRITNQRKRKNSENAIYESIQDLNLNQTPNQKTTEDASGLSPNSTYALLGFPAAPVRSTETVNTPKPENIYVLITEVPKSDHHPEVKNTENNNDLVHSQD